MKISAGVVGGLILVGTASARADDGRHRPLTPYQTTLMRNFKPAISDILRPAATCQASERQCQSNGFIIWCCRADQQCGRRYPGDCR